MAFTDMLRNNAPQAASTGGTGYGNEFLGTFANLAYGSPNTGQAGAKMYNKYGLQIGGEGADPQVIKDQMQRDAIEEGKKEAKYYMDKAVAVDHNIGWR